MGRLEVGEHAEIMTIKVRYAFLAGALVTGLSLSAPALADTFTTYNTPVSGDGYAVEYPSGPVDLFGSNNGATTGVSQVLTTYEATASQNITYRVDWTYTTNDSSGDPSLDPAGYYVDNVGHQLSDDTGDVTQHGSFLVSILAGQTYGLYVDTLNNTGGRADLYVNATALPLPATLPLLASGLGFIGLLVHKRKRKLA